MEDLIQTIKNLRSELKTYEPLKPEDQKRLDRKFRLEFNYNSNHLEGNTLTYGETKLLLLFDETKGNHKLREYEEMKAHDVALQVIKEWAADKERPLTELNIKQLNEIVLVKPFWKEATTPEGHATRRLIAVGDYKAFPNSVRLSNGEIFEYASVADTPILMGELISWFREESHKKELHPVQLAALLHYRFVRIHPFDDGNGRIARLLMNYVLINADFPPVVIKSNDKRNYLSALNQADAGDLTAFVDYVSRQMIWSLELYIRAAQGHAIDESDDLDKEIEVWKRNAVSKKMEAPRRNDQVVLAIYRNHLSKLIVDFVDKHQQFNELFGQVNYLFTKNGNKYLNKKFFESSMMSETGIETDDTFRQLSCSITFQDYNYNEENIFSHTAKLIVDFAPYRYRITYRKILNGEKLEVASLDIRYDEFITGEQQSRIINESLQHTFAVIKGKTEN